MRGGRFLSCRHGAMGVVHLVVVHGPGHGVDFSGIVQGPVPVVPVDLSSRLIS